MTGSRAHKQAETGHGHGHGHADDRHGHGHVCMYFSNPCLNQRTCTAHLRNCSRVRAIYLLYTPRPRSCHSRRPAHTSCPSSSVHAPPPAGIHTDAYLSLSSSEEKEDSGEDSDSTHSSLSLSCDVAGTAFAAKSLASLNRCCPISPPPPSAPLVVWSSPACCCRAGVSLAYSAGDRTVRIHLIALGMGMRFGKYSHPFKKEMRTLQDHQIPVASKYRNTGIL